MPKYLPLPDGSFFKVANDVDYDTAVAEAKVKFPKAFGLEKKGVGAAFGKGLESLISSGYTGLQALTESPEEAAALGLQRQKALEQQYADQIGLDLVKQKYEKEGLGAAGKEVLRQVPLALAEQAPNIGATIASGRVGARLGRVAGPMGSLVGGVAGAAAPSLVQQFGGNIERQAAEGQPIDVGAAGAAAVPQAALDVAGTFIPFGKTLIGKAFGKDVAAALNRGATKSAERLAEESLKKSLAKGLGIGAMAEIPTEVAQQMLERAQAGLSLTSDDALAEYGNTAYQVGLLAPIGSVGRVVDRGAARKDIAEKKAAEEAAASLKAEQERLASPQYYDQLLEERAKVEAKVADMNARLAAGKAKNPEKLQGKLESATAELEDFDAKLAAHPLHEQRLAKAEEQAQTDKTLGMFGEWQQQAQADAAAKEERAARGVPENVGALPGFEQPYTPVETAPQVPPLEDLRKEHATLKTHIEQLEQQKADAAMSGNTSVIAQLDQELAKVQSGYAEASRMLKEHPELQMERLTKRLAQAGEEGDFQTISKLAAQIEQLKAQGVAAPVMPTYNQQQEALLTRQGKPTALATATVKEGVKREEAKRERATGAAKTRQQLLAEEEAQQLEGPATTELETLPGPEPRSLSEVLLGTKTGVEPVEGRRVLGRPAQPMKLEQANSRAEDAVNGYKEIVDEIAGGYHLGGKNEKLAGPMDENLVTKEDLVAQTEESKAKVIDAMLAKADNLRLDNGMQRLDDQAAMALARELNDIVVKHTSDGGMAPQMPNRLAQAVTRYAKVTPEEVKRGRTVAQEEEAAGFALEPQTEEKLAEKVAAEEGAGKTNRDETVSDLIDKALDTEPTGAIATVLKEAQRIIDSGKAPRTLVDEAEAQALRIINGKTPQMRTLYDETVIAKEGKVTEETQQHFPQFAQKGTIRPTSEKFLRFINTNPKIVYKAEEYRRFMSEMRKLLGSKSSFAERVRRGATASAVKEYNLAIAQIDKHVSEMADYLKFLKTEQARGSTPWIMERSYAKKQAEVEAWLKEASDTVKQMDALLETRLAEAEKMAANADVVMAKAKKATAGLKTTTNEERQRFAKGLAAIRESQDKAEKARREWDVKLEEATKHTPKVVSKVVSKEVSANDIRYLKKMRSQAQADLKTAEASLAKMPDDEEFKANKADAEVRLANVNKQLADVVRAGGKTKGQPVGASVAKRVVETIEPESAETVKERKKAERAETVAAIKEKVAVRRKLIAEGKSTSVVGMRNEIEKLNERLAEKNAKGKNAIVGTARAELVKKRTALNKKLETILKKDRLMLAITRKEEVPGGMITPQKIVKGTNVQKVAEEAEAEKAASFREDEGAMEDLAFAQATLLRDTGTPPAKQVDAKDARASAEKAKAKMAKAGIKLEYYDSAESLPAKLKAVLAAKGTQSAKGMILPDGTVVVIGDMHDSTYDLQKTIAHEVIGHYGVEGAIGAEGIRALADKIFAVDGQIGKIARALGVAEEVEGARKAAEAMGLSEKETQDLMVRELIAHTAEAKAKGEGAIETVKSWIRTLVNAVRNWFARSGLDEMAKATTKEIQTLVNDAAKNYAKNEMPAYTSANGDVHFRGSAEYASSYNPRLQALSNKVLAKEKSLKDTILANATGLRFAIQFVDRFAGLEHIARNMKDRLAAFQMMYWNRAYDARNMVIAETATNGPRTIESKVRKDGSIEKIIGASGAPGLKDIAEEVGKSAKRIGNANAALREFGMYLTAKRAKRVGIDVAFGNNSSVTQADLDEVIRAGDADPHFKKAADMYAQYNKALINFLAQSGAISKASADKMTKYGDYVGFYREKDGLIVDGEHTVTIGDLTHNKFLKELVGSDQAIVDFRTSSLQNTALITDIALRNVATKNTAYTLKALGLAKILDGKGPAKDNVVRFKEHGVDKYALIDSDAAGIPADLLVKGMEGVSTSLPAAIRFMQGPANLLRKGVTRMPLYAVRQVIRDSLASVMTGGVNATPVMSSMKELASLMSGTNVSERALQSQGFIGGQVFSATPDDMKLIMSDIAAGKDHWTTLMSKLDHLAMKSDAASRVVAYNSFIKQGMSEMEASLAALEMMNFTKRGISPSVMAISNMIPFFNAQIQGLNVLVKAFRGTSLTSKKLEIQGKLLKRGAMMMGMSLIYAAMMSDDEAYKNATPEEKYNNWFVYIPGVDEPVRVPIPFEIGYIFKALPEALYNLAATDEKADQTLKAFKQMAINTIPGGSNLMLPQAIKPAFEVAANYSIFTGKPIEGSRMAGVAPGKRATEGTSELAKTLGDMIDVSPIKIDYLIRGYTGGLGAAMAAMLNPVLASPEKPGTPEKKLSELPFIGQAFQPTDGRGIINEAFDTMERAQQAKGTVNNLVERGMLDEAKEFQKENATLIAASSAAGKFRQQMGEYAKQKRQIAVSPNLTPEEKRRTIDAIKQKEIALAKQLKTIE